MTGGTEAGTNDDAPLQRSGAASLSSFVQLP